MDDESEGQRGLWLHVQVDIWGKSQVRTQSVGSEHRLSLTYKVLQLPALRWWESNRH